MALRLSEGLGSARADIERAATTAGKTPEEACDGKRRVMKRVAGADKRLICSSRSERERERPKRTEAKAMAEP